MAHMAVPPTSSQAEADSARLSRSGQGTGTHRRHQVAAGEMGRVFGVPLQLPGHVCFHRTGRFPSQALV